MIPANRSSVPWWLILIALCIVSLAPLLLVDVPPLLDYPNHLARLFVLAADGKDPVLARMYALHWGVIPNLGIDAVGAWLAHVMPIHVAGRVLIATTLLLEVLGTVAYARVVLGRSYWPLACGLVAFNETVLLGFLNFTASTGLAMLLGASWLHWRDRRPAVAIALALIGTAALFFCHLMGLLLFAVLIGAHELTTLRTASFGSVVKRGGAVMLVFIIPLRLYAASNLQGMAGDAEYLPPLAKVSQLFVPFVNYSLPLDVLTAGAVSGFVLVCLMTRRCRVPLRSRLAIFMLLLLYAVAPFGFKGTYNLDTRFAVMLGLMLFAGLTPVGLPRWAVRGAATVFTLLFLARIGVLGTAWYQYNTDLAELRAAIASVRPDDRVFLTSVSQAEAPGYWRYSPWARSLSNGSRTDVHIAALVLIEHRAYWPFLFDNASQQPVATREPYRALANRVQGIKDHSAVASADLCGFDRLLLLEAGADTDLARYADDRMSLIVATDFAALFVIRPNPLCS